jgi:phage shock protein PspC (stress-responsive transcriptional regulator)
MAARRREAHDASMDTTMTPPPPPRPDADPGASRPGTEPPDGPRSNAGPLTRSRNDRMLAGVAGGIARKYDFDPGLVRVVFVGVTILTYGFAIIPYLVAWLVVPESDVDEPVLSSAVRHARRYGPRRRFDKRFLLGLLLLALGANALAERAGFRFDRFGRVFWPMVLIGSGAAILLVRDRDRAAPEAGPDPSAGSPPPRVASPTDSGPVTDAAVVADGPEGAPPSPPYPPTAYPPTRPWPEVPRPRAPRLRRRRERSMLGRLTWSALLVVAGTAWMINVTGAASFDVRVVIAIELAIVGVALVAGAWFGRARGLIVLGLLLTLVAGTLSVLDVPLRGPIGERIVRPNAIGELDGRYQLGIGHLELDLRGVALDGKAHDVVLTDAIGFVEVFVPADARVEVIARTDAGSIDLFGRHEGDGTQVRRVVFDDPAGATGPRLVIDAHVGFGAVKVSRGERVSQ